MANSNEKNSQSTFSGNRPTPDPRFAHGPPQALSSWILPTQNNMAITQLYQPSVDPSTVLRDGTLEIGAYDLGTLHQLPIGVNPMTSSLPPAYGTGIASGMVLSQSISPQQQMQHQNFRSGIHYSVQNQHSRPMGAQRRASTPHEHSYNPLQYHAKLAQGNTQFHRELPSQPAPTFYHQQNQQNQQHPQHQQYQQHQQSFLPLSLQHQINPQMLHGHHPSSHLTASQTYAAQDIDMVPLTIQPTDLQDIGSFMTQDIGELSGQSSEKQVISLTVATNNLALSTPTTSPVTATRSSASLSRVKSKKRTGGEGRRTSNDASHTDTELAAHKKIANKRSRDQLNKVYSLATTPTLFERHHHHQYWNQQLQLQLQLQLQQQHQLQQLQSASHHYPHTTNNSNTASTSSSVSLSPSPQTGPHRFSLQRAYLDSSHAPTPQFQPPLTAQLPQASSHSVPRSFDNQSPLVMVEKIPDSNIQHQVFQNQAHIQQQQCNQQQEHIDCQGSHAPVPPKRPLYQLPHEAPSLAALAPFPNATTSFHSPTSSSSSSSSAPFPPFSDKVGRSLDNQFVPATEPNPAPQQHSYTAQTATNDKRSPSPTEPSSPFGGELSGVGFMRILDKEEEMHSPMMEVLQHQKPHCQGFLQKDQNHFFTSDRCPQQFHQQSQPFQSQVRSSSESPSPSIASAPPSSSFQSLQRQLQLQEQQQEDDCNQQEVALNRLKDLFEQNDLKEMGICGKGESMHFHTMPLSRSVNSIETRDRSRTLPGQSTYPETAGKPYLNFYSSHSQQHQQQQVETQQVQARQDTLFNSSALGDILTSDQSQRMSEPLEMLKTASLSLDVLDTFMVDPSTALFAPGSSASPPPSWLLESDFGVGLVNDPDDDETEIDVTDDWSSTQAYESGIIMTNGVRHVGGRAVGGSRPNSSTSPKYECLLCNRVYTRPFNLRSHMLVHEDKKPFACELCDSRFTRRHDMVRHVKTRHKNQQQDVIGENGEDGGLSSDPAIASSVQTQSQEQCNETVIDTLEVLQ